MGEGKTIHTHHHRQQDFVIFGDLERLHVRVISLLNIFDVQLDNATVPETKRILMVGLQPNRCRHLTIAPCEHHWQACAVPDSR